MLQEWPMSPERWSSSIKAPWAGQWGARQHWDQSWVEFSLEQCEHPCLSLSLGVSVVSLHLLPSSGAGGDQEETAGQLKELPGRGQ